MEFISEHSNERLDKFLAAHYTGISRSRFQKLIGEGAIKVNRRIVNKPALLLKKGDRILILEEKALTKNGKEFVVEPEPDIQLGIIYEDDDIVAINKPAGLLVHPTLSQKRHTLANALIARYPEMVKVGESPMRPGIVHRLDKDTSGIIIAAKNQTAFLHMKEQFLNRKIFKKYLALVEGVPKNETGVIEYAIRPSKQFRLKKVAVQRVEPVKKSVRTARTSYKIRAVINGYTFLEVSPLTGRTHQIRVHLAAIGHPIIGDRLYNTRKEDREKWKEIGIKRQFLHAFSLEFTAPNGQKLKLEAELPRDLREIIAMLK